MSDFFQEFHTAVFTPLLTSQPGNVILIRLMRLIWKLIRTGSESMNIKFKRSFGDSPQSDYNTFMKDVEQAKNSANSGLRIIDQTLVDFCEVLRPAKRERKFYTDGNINGKFAQMVAKRVFEAAEETLIANNDLQTSFEEWVVAYPESEASLSSSKSSSSPLPEKQNEGTSSAFSKSSAKASALPELGVDAKIDPKGIVTAAAEEDRKSAQRTSSTASGRTSSAGKVARMITHLNSSNGQGMGRYSKSINMTASMDNLRTLRGEDKFTLHEGAKETSSNSSSAPQPVRPRSAIAPHPSIMSVNGVSTSRGATPVEPSRPMSAEYMRASSQNGLKRKGRTSDNDPQLFGTKIRRQTLAQVFYHLGMAMQSLHTEFADTESGSDD